MLADLIFTAIVLPKAVVSKEGAGLTSHWRWSVFSSYCTPTAPVAEAKGGRGDTPAAIFSCDARDIPPQSQTCSFHQHPDSPLCEAVIHYWWKINIVRRVQYYTLPSSVQGWLDFCAGGRFGEENSRICAFSDSTLMTASVCASVCVWHWEVGPPSPRQRERNRGCLLYTVELSAVCSSGVSQAVIFGLNGAYVKERPVAYFVTYVADIRW